EAKPGPSAVSRLRDRALATNTSTATLALSAILVESATMWPYLVGISLIAANGPGLPLDILWLAFYNVIMILPARLLTWARAAYPAPTYLVLSGTGGARGSAGPSVTAWRAVGTGGGIILAGLWWAFVGSPVQRSCSLRPSA